MAVVQYEDDVHIFLVLFWLLIFRLRQILNASVLVNDSVSWYVCLSVTRLRHAKAAEWIEVLLGVETRAGPGKIILDGLPSTSAASSDYFTGDGLE